MTSTRSRPRYSRTRLLRTTALGGIGIGFSTLFATPAAAQVCTVPVLGQLVCPGNSTSATVNVVNSPTPQTITLNDGYNSVTTVAASTLAGSDLTLISNGTSVVQTANQPGVVLNSGNDLTARVNTITTAGDGATGAVLTALDDLIFVSDGTIRTTGNLADGINAQGRTINVTSNIIRTSGTDADGAELVALNGPIDFRSNLIETSGGLSAATILRGTGTINANVGVLRTSGGQAAGADISSSAAACILLGQNGCNTNLNASEITTSGFGSVGALINAVGRTTVNATLLQTGGDQAAGLSLSAVPAACVAIGVGSCDTAFTVQNLTTNGASSPGALVRAAGDINGNVTVLRTNGANAAGVDLASDPSACAILGRGGCDTSFSAGQLTTSGAGSTGALIRSAGATTVNITALQTLGNNATGIDILADPTACALIGAGACVTNINAGTVRTQGNGSGAVVANAPAQINAVLGQVSTAGSGATGVSLITNPAVCIVLGPGACGVTERSTGVVTTGPNSPGVVIVTPGAVTAQPGDVSTSGPNSPGVTVTSPSPITLTCPTTVSTAGDNSSGIVVRGGEGAIDVCFVRVATAGNTSPTVDVSGTGQITVRGGDAFTNGTNSTGVLVRGDNDPINVTVGTVAVTGAGSNALDVAASGCANINIATTGPITSAAGIGISAATQCAVNITTGAASPVSGAVAGINAVSGTGATISIGNGVSSSAGPALNVDGAPAIVTVRPGGSITGFIDLTGGADTLTNNGSLNLSGNSTFGAGTDLLINAGIITVRGGTATVAALESTSNSGTIDLRNGAAIDRLNLSGNFTGSGGSTVGIDVQAAGGTGLADRLVIAGAATGQTQLLVNTLAGQPGGVINGAVVVDAGAGTSAGAFVLPPTSAGFINYSLTYAAAANDFLLFGTPNAAAISQYKLTEGSRQIFFRGNDAVGSHLQALGDDADSGSARQDQRGSRALWGIMYGDYSTYRDSTAVAQLGITSTVSLDYGQDVFGAQLGYDFGGVGDADGRVIGVTAGYANSKLRFEDNADRFKYETGNAGLYGRAAFGSLFFKGYVKYEHYWITSSNLPIGFRAKSKGNAYGGMLEAGAHLLTGGLFVEPAATVEIVRSKMNDFTGLGSTFDYDASTGVRGRAGIRVGSNSVRNDRVTKVYVGAAVVKEWIDDSDVNFINSGFSLTASGPGIGTYGEAKAGFSVAMGTRVSGFIEASGRYSDRYKGGGARAGLSLKF